MAPRALSPALVGPPVEGAPHRDADRERVSCAHEDECGGCPLIGLPYSEQLARKRGRVVESVARYPLLNPLYTNLVASPASLVGYRARAKLMVSEGGFVGLFASGGGHRVVDIPDCRVLSPPLARVAAVLRALIAAARVQGGALAPRGEASGCLRAVDLREARGEGEARVLVTLVVDPSRGVTAAQLRAAAELLTSASEDVAGVAANYQRSESPQVLGGETVLLSGAASLPDRIGASHHFATFGSFVQAHREQAAQIHRLLVQELGVAGPPHTSVRVLDLYGGSGAIAMALASAGATVRMIESFSPAAAQARAAAEAQSLDVEAECSDVAGALRRARERSERFDAVVLNPPRRGACAAAREGLARLSPAIIAYVSCNPETLARDLDHFARLGFRAASLKPFDMIPLTDEVETVAVLRPSQPPSPCVLYEDDEVLIVDKSPHEPTMPQGEYVSSLLARARRLEGASHAVPVHRLDVGTSGIVVLARRPELVPKWAGVLGALSTRQIHLAFVRGIAPAKGAVVRDLSEAGRVVRARTRFRRLSIASGQSVLRVVPDQNRSHQIRRHLASLGNPILGDERYGHPPSNRHFEEKHGLDRLFLHAIRLEFDHPSGGARCVVESPLAGDLRAVLERLDGGGALEWLAQKNALGSSALSAPPGLTEDEPRED